MKIILASGSPRRRELMHYITDDFEVRTSDADETLPEDTPSHDAAVYLAMKKAEAVAADYSDDIVIGCDTTVILDGRIMGKPADTDDARNMLMALSGRTHEVVTGTAVLCRGKSIAFSEVTRVSFYPLSMQKIDAYLATGEPYDKAGSYGIQGKGALFIKGIEGDYYNVVGLPIASLSRKLKEIMDQQ